MLPGEIVLLAAHVVQSFSISTQVTAHTLTGPKKKKKNQFQLLKPQTDIRA